MFAIVVPLSESIMEIIERTEMKKLWFVFLYCSRLGKRAREDAKTVTDSE